MLNLVLLPLCNMVPSANQLGLIMTKNTRVFHVRGFTRKLGSAEKSIREGNSVWVEKGVLFRDATPEEMFEAMNLTAEERDKRDREAKELGQKEVFGLMFQPCASGIAATRREKFLTWQARYFAQHGKMPELVSQVRPGDWMKAA